jgi:hypothetical protein
MASTCDRVGQREIHAAIDPLTSKLPTSAPARPLRHRCCHAYLSHRSDLLRLALAAASHVRPATPAPPPDPLDDVNKRRQRKEQTTEEAAPRYMGRVCFPPWKARLAQAATPGVRFGVDLHARSWLPGEDPNQT